MTHVAAAIEPTPPHDTTWTEERVALLIELRAANMSRRNIASEINSKTGSQFTKSAVCGKIDRLFPVAKPRKTEEEKAATIREQRDRYNAKKREETRQKRIAWGADPDKPRNQPRKAQSLVVVPFRPEDFTDANIHGVANLEDHRCHHPMNDDMREPVYCGLPVMDGKSCCAGHHGIWYLPARSRQDRWRPVS